MKYFFQALCKSSFSLCAALCPALFFSCSSSQQLNNWSSIEGEWNIIELKGSTVVPGQEQKFPFIGFDTTEGRIYGNAGCNSLIGSFDLKEKPGKLDLSKVGTTMMMCPDMELEQRVLSVLGDAKQIRPINEQQMGLYDGSSKPLAVLQRKAADQ